MYTFESAVNRNAFVLLNYGPQVGVYPAMYSTPKDELLACRNTAWLGNFLDCSPVYDIKGPDSVKLLNHVCVNRDFSKLKIGGSRHALLCNDKGQLLADGLLIRTGDDSFRTYWLASPLAYYVDTLGMDVEGSWVFDEYFYQIDGPKSLEIMEKAAQTDLHDMKFAARRNIKIAGTGATIVRLGMSGALAYEFHGNIQDRDVAYNAVLQAGQEYGIKELGFTQYCRNHTQGGYPNQWIHFWYPLLSSGEKLAKYHSECEYIFIGHRAYPFLGSASDDPQNAFVTPFDLDWDYLINYDHEFIGKSALQELAKNPPRKCVTLEWNAEDVGRVFASQFMGLDVNPADNIATVGDGGEAPFIISKVLLDGEMVGVTAGRTQDYYHQKMISLAYIRRDLAVEGKELIVLWGTPGTHQMEIRTTVAPFPYYHEVFRNETFDVEAIPHPSF